VILMDERDDIPEEVWEELKSKKPDYTNVTCRIGIDTAPNKGIKAMYLGAKKIWTNPDYEKGGCFYDGS
jgi:hypothetical protein